MSKKKKKKSVSILKEVDNALNGTYDDLIEEIQDMQMRLNLADQQLRKKAKHKKKHQEEYEQKRKQVREEIVSQIQGNSFLDRAMNFLKDLTPIVAIIGRLIASLILAILSMDIVKVNIKPETLIKMNAVYQKAMSVC